MSPSLLTYIPICSAQVQTIPIKFWLQNMEWMTKELWRNLVFLAGEELCPNIVYGWVNTKFVDETKNNIHSTSQYHWYCLDINAVNLERLPEVRTLTGFQQKEIKWQCQKMFSAVLCHKNPLQCFYNSGCCLILIWVMALIESQVWYSEKVAVAKIFHFK